VADRVATGYGMADESVTIPPLSYNRYLKVPELIRLQEPQSDPPHHDEILFIIIHQAYELWFKLILHELDTVAQLLDEAARVGPGVAGRRCLRRAAFYLRRVTAVQRLLAEQIHILSTMSPRDFLGFRNHLNPASGFQSGQFREIEFLAGLRSAELLEHFTNEPEVRAALERRLAEPALGDRFYAVLRAWGYHLPQPPAGADPQTVAAAEQQRLQELTQLFSDDEHHHELREVAEQLVEFDEYLALWRLNHVQVVERQIGFKRGTGGSSGVAYLVGTLGKRAFPDLWKMRTVLTE